MDLEFLRNCIIYNDINKIFNHIAFPCCIVKGKPLSVQAYGSCNKRISSDIDFLFSKKHIKQFENILFQFGYAPSDINRINRILCLSASHQLPPYTKENNGVHIEFDLNFDIFWGEYTGKRVDIEEFLSDAIEMKIYGVKVKALPPLKAMVQLILHHYKDMNSIFLLATRKSIKFDMFKDIYYLLKNNVDTISLNKLYKISAEYGIIPYVYYVLYHADLLFDDEILREYVSIFKTPEGDELLNCYGLNDNERREWKNDFKTRLESNNLYELIKSDLTAKDEEKIVINKKVFLGE